ncbi:18926_t:CDS:2 [Rhizophagus irregularis]|nr:18926_t:CDS:2 [Rhizophagus irregularis]
MVKYQGYSEVKQNGHFVDSWFFIVKLLFPHPSSKDWRELNKTWVDRFLGAAKKLSDKKIFADLTEKSFAQKNNCILNYWRFARRITVFDSLVTTPSPQYGRPNFVVKSESKGHRLKPYWKGVITENKTEFKKRKQENKENIDSEGRRKSTKRLPYPSIRSWATNGIISPDQRDKYYYADPAKTNTELLNSILEGKFVALHGPRSSDTIESGSDFAVAFNEWKSVVIFIDEFDRLYGTIDKVHDEFLGCFRTIKHAMSMNVNYPILSVIIVGTFGILELNSSNTYDSPFNVRDPFQNPNLSEEQVQRLFEEFGSEHKLNVESKVIEDIYLQTNGHASMVCLCGNLIEKIKLPDNDDNFSFASWKNLLFTSLNKNIYGYVVFERMLTDLLKEESRPTVDLLRLQFLPNLGPVTITRSKDLIHAHNLVRQGILIVVEDQINTFMVASPLIRSVILRYVLPDIFKFCPSTEIPKRTDHNIDMLRALSDAVRVFDKENIELAALHSYKTAQVPVGGCSNVLVPRESVYQQQLAGTFTNWISSIGFEVMSQYHIIKRKKHSYSDLVITAPSSWPGKPTVILELLATSTQKELDEHFERTLKYSQLLKRSLCIRDIWTVHFTCEDEPNHHWPTKEQRKKGLNAIMFWHNRDFTSVYMSACYNDENGNMIDITKEYIM